MPYLMVNIDTEEEGLFGREYPRAPWRLGHLAQLPRLQSIFDRFGVRPSYLVTSPVVHDRAGSEHLLSFLKAGRCDIGGHLHPWATPPVNHPADDAHSMPCMLPTETVRAQLRTLTGEIRDRFGIQPVAYRSGRYGSAAAHTPLLLEQGYRIETSVCPFVSHADAGGPNYYDAPLQPYWLGTTSMLHAEPQGRLLSVPISAGFNRTHFAAAVWVHRQLCRPSLRRLRGVGALYRLGLLRLIRLNPEMTSLADMIALCRCLLRRRVEVIHLTFHSSNIGVGGTPYVPTITARDAFLDRLAGVLQFLTDRGVQPVTARAYYELFARRQASCMTTADAACSPCAEPACAGG